MKRFTRVTTQSIILATALLAMGVGAQSDKPESDPPPTNSQARGVGGTGGPDNFGYTYADSTTGQCAVQFVDISATGTNVGTGDDSGFPVTLATGFDFYGTMLTDVGFTTNGYISTDSTDTGPDLSNDCPMPAVPSTGGGGRIMPVHDDINMSPSGALFYEYIEPCPRPSDQFPTQDLGCHVFQWDSAEHFGGGGPWDFQALLYNDSWEIVFQHGAGNPETGSASTTAIMNPAHDDALTYACNTASSVPDNSAQCFTHPQPAVAIGPTSVPTTNPLGLLILSMIMLAGALIALRRFA